MKRKAMQDSPSTMDPKAGIMKSQLNKKKKMILKLEPNRKLVTIEDHFPYEVTFENRYQLTFSLHKFMRGVRFYLNNDVCTSGVELLYIGEKNKVYKNMDKGEQEIYNEFRDLYRHLYKDFKNTTNQFYAKLYEDSQIEARMNPEVEICLHDLRNPGRSLTALFNNKSGRFEGNAANSLVVMMAKESGSEPRFRKDYSTYRCRINGKWFVSSSYCWSHKIFGSLFIKCRNRPLDDESPPLYYPSPFGPIEILSPGETLVV